ncbi:HEAT repeat domain-containing protein [Tundrisphaera lichenicola]|uniref:HEAT repeat domain-containing protein n=1 Tax=Tundrisphaera lichenicola TaxID=2029860 RepID=UPI003EBD652F
MTNPGRTSMLLVMILLGSIARPAPARDGSPIEGLKSKEVAVRRDSANKVRLAGKDVQLAALPALIEILMSEKDGQVRLATLDAVTMLGPDAEPAIPALVHTLKTSYGGGRQEETHQDYRSALALGAIGKPAVEALRGLLGERKQDVRAEVVMALGRIGFDAAPAVPDLFPLFGDESERVRRETSLALGAIGPAAIEPLLASSKDQDLIVREKAVEGLGFLSEPDDRARSALLELARDEHPEVRAAAIRSLARTTMPDEVLRPVLRENLEHEDDRVRLAVVGLLVGHRTLLPQMVPELETLLASPNEGIARHAAFLLGKSGLEAAPRLLEALRSEGSRVEPISGALAQIGRPAIELLSRSIEAPESRVRQGAALALGQIRPLAPGLAKRLTVGLSDPDPEVRAAFLTAIGHLGTRATESVPAVRALLEDKSPGNRARAIEVLFQAAPKDDRLLDDLMARLDDPDAKVRTRAIGALRALGPMGRKALGPIIGQLGVADPEVRLAAAQFVESHGQAAVEATPALAALLSDPSPKIRTIAAQSLGRFGKSAQPAFDPLVSLMNDDQVEVREAAVSAIGSLELDAQLLRSPLARALRDDKTEVRRAASRAIAKLGPSGVILVPDIILMAARKENARSVDRLLRPFERTGPDPASLPELVKLLDHEQVAVRLLAIKYLGLAGSRAKEALTALERFSEDPNAEVRDQARAACDRIKKNADPGPPKDPV